MFSQRTTNLALSHRAALRDQFQADIAAGRARPLVVPFDALGSLIIPLIYLCIPHTRRPWLYKLRFGWMALIIWLNWNLMLRAASTNMAIAYGTGVAGAWGVLWSLTVFIWMRPQFDAARVERRRKKGGVALQNGQSNGAVSGGKGDMDGIGKQTQENAPDETVANALEDGYEYYWQPYPADSPLLSRLDWAFDYASGFRGSGWTTSITSIPSFKRPDKPQSRELVDLSSIPITTKTGYARHLTVRSFLLSRLRHMLVGYLTLDICLVTMRHDPYFILGPDHGLSLPTYLISLPKPVLELYRTTLSLGIILSALYMIFALGQVAQFLLCRRFPSLGCRGDLWQYPSVFGSFTSNVLDHGLAGFWGGWWHQTFRMAFIAPTDWMVANGILPKDKHHPLTQFVGSLVAFGQSSILHAAGSWTSLPKEARPWSPPLFFLASLVGVMVQMGWCSAVLGKEGREMCPRWARRGGNLVFVLVWLHLTRWAFVDDLSRGGVWLFEPVPVSVVRMLGFGEAGDDAVWRWTPDERPKFWVGRRWWESGIAI